MPAPDKSILRLRAPEVADDAEIALDEFLGALAPHARKPLVFACDGRRLRPGYHVTEVKAGAFSSLDCGANPEAWREIFIQLWDVDGDGRDRMRADKFAAIIRKVADQVGIDPASRLTFEISDGVRPMQLYRIAAAISRDDEIVVDLAPRPASCKPRDRWLATETAKASACCRTKPVESCCA